MIDLNDESGTAGGQNARSEQASLQDTVIIRHRSPDLVPQPRRAEERFRGMIESAPIAMIMIDAHGVIVLANCEAERLFDYSCEELLGRSVEVLVPERFRASHPQMRSAFLANPEARRMGAGRNLFGLRKDRSEFPVEIGLNPVQLDEGLFVISVIVDISERKLQDEALRKAEQEMQRLNKRLNDINRTLRADRTLLEAIQHAQTQFIFASCPRAVFDDILNSLLILSNSEYGFVDELYYTPEGQPYLTADAITNIAWSDESKRMYQQFLEGSLNFTSLNSLFGAVITSREPVIANDAPHDPRRAGIPPGHPPLKAFLGIPLISNSQEFVGVIGLANRPGGYSQDVINHLQPMVVVCANLISARRNEQRRQETEQARVELNQRLADANTSLDRIVEERTAQLRASEERFELAVRGSTDGIWDWKIPTDEVYFSPRFKELLGYSDDELSNDFASFESHLHPDDRSWFKHEVDEHLSNHKPFDVEYSMRTKSGAYRWFRARGQALWDEAGQAQRMAGSITDVTEAHRLRERFRVAVEASPTALLMVNVDGRILTANSRCVSLFGYTEQELTGQPVELLVPMAFRDGHPALREEFFKDPVQRTMAVTQDVVGVRKDATEFPVKVELSPVRTEEGLVVICGVMDVTDQKAALTALRLAKDVAESASRAKSSFLANMSHEIRTPMNGIIGMAQLLSRTELRSHQRDYLATIDESAQILLRLLNDILDFSKIEAGKLELESVDFRLSECVARASQILILRAAEKGLEMACRVAPGIPDHLKGDSGRLQQVLVNLLGNAVKFTEAGEVYVNVDEESRTQDAIRLHFSVTDTGIGIPRDKQQQIFRPFIQAEASTTRRFGGTGLGLAISHQLVEMMHGRMWVESEAGHGSTFHFTVELEFAPEQHDRTPVEIHALKDAPVLVVDDNSTNRQILGELLSHWEMQPVLVESAEAARLALQAAASSNRPFRLILLDHHMPGEDGFQFAEGMRHDSTNVQCPIIMISSGASPVDADACQRVGIHRFLTKPVIASELLNEILLEFDGTTLNNAVTPPNATVAECIAPRRVLLVEDNEINRRVAVGLLRSRGHQVVLAENGKVALDILAEEVFDVILMDIQMPVMDGYEATAAIRQREHQTGGHVPVVAMTAEALKGDRERFLAIGMDDYVSKPIERAEMYRAIERFPAVLLADLDARSGVSVNDSAGGASSSNQSNTETHPDSPAPAEPPPVDWAVAKNRLGCDDQVLREFADIFTRDAPNLSVEIHSAIEARDATLLRRAAHTLKGSATYFGAEPLVQAAQTLETSGRESSFDHLGDVLATLDYELGRVLHALEAVPPISNSSDDLSCTID